MRPGRARLAADLTEQLDSAAAVSARSPSLGDRRRGLALSLFGLTETHGLAAARGWPMPSRPWGRAGGRPSSSCSSVGSRPRRRRAPTPGLADQPPIDDFAAAGSSTGRAPCVLRVHPRCPRPSALTRPEGELPAATARWARSANPTAWSRSSGWRRSGSGSASSRSARPSRAPSTSATSERLEEDPVLAGPIDDALEPLAGHAGALAGAGPPGRPDRARPADDRLVGGRAGILGRERDAPAPDDRHELAGPARAGGNGTARRGPISTSACRSPFLRPAVLLWLAMPGRRPVGRPRRPGRAPHGAANPEWDRLSFQGEPESAAPPYAVPPVGRGKAGPAIVARGEGPAGTRLAAPRGGLRLRAGPRGREQGTTGARVVQLTPLGRYVLAMGPPPPPRPAFEHFLFVQPNLEVIAYRQGLTPQLIGRLSAGSPGGPRSARRWS